ncbi:MAG: hypothetical protein C0523_03580 [Cytophaga sp.]|jgi:hypothetical protein|nr:hypothetical protein [Cytophaga sp.]
MFSSITWNDFLTYAGSFVFIYYTLCLPWFFRHEISRRLRNKDTTASEGSPLDENGMGAAQTQRLERIAERIEEEPVFTATVTPVSDPEVASDKDTREINLISAVMIEASTLARVIAESAENNEDIDSMFRSMLESYSELVRSPYAKSINVFLLNACLKEGLAVTAPQVESWWSSSAATQ